MFLALKCGIASSNLAVTGATLRELRKVLATSNVNKVHVAGLTRAVFRDESDTINLKPWPYHEKQCLWWHAAVSEGYKRSRVQKHTKLIVVDGPPAAGKHKLAQKLACEFDFLYLPQPTFDDLYIDQYGFDMRSLDCKFPVNLQTWDIERFLQNPTHINTAAMQLNMLHLRQNHWMHCLLHLISTGQGVVTVRSPWSDTVFARAMLRNGYISPKAFGVHTDNTRILLHPQTFLKPHLIVYLDVTVDKTLEKIKARCRPHEQNSKVLTKKYLKDIEDGFKNIYISYLKDYGFVLAYDWDKIDDVEEVVADIEQLNFEGYSDHETMFTDWHMKRFQHMWYVSMYSGQRQEILSQAQHIHLDVPELLISGEEEKLWHETIEKIPEVNRYADGFNASKGDKGFLWKKNVFTYPDYVTPVMNKYLERKAREEGKSPAITTNN